jgi:chemosensory pili system protein ChpA (sensor histidine kinase/response regulator)
VEPATRAAHTLKGAANTGGARGIANLTHHIEDILMVYSGEKTLPGGATASLLIRAADCLEAMNEALQGTGPVPDDARAVLQAVLDRANGLDDDGLLPEAPVDMVPLTRSEPDAPKSEPEPMESALSMLRIPTHLADELLRLVGESITTNAQTQERLRVSLRQTRAVQAQNQLLRQLVGELDALVDIRGIAATQQQAAQEGGFDALEMQQYGELHTVTNRLLEAITDANEIAGQGEEGLSALAETLEVQSRLQLESQEAVLRTRMVRVETVVPRLQRGVRQAARLLDKGVHLDVQGGNTLVDGQVLGELIDPLMHVLRNSVDHGIEAVARRQKEGKSPTGQIQLTFSREGNNILVRCQDDGHGLDTEAIRAQAVRQGLVDSATTLSDEEVTQLILVSGFSTRQEATQVSGRGIGMDIVHQRVLDLKGSLTLHSVPKKGMRVEIRIPLTMLSTHSLLVRVGQHTVAVSTRNIEDIHFVLPEQIKALGEKRHYQSNQVVHDVVRLEDLLNMPGGDLADGRVGFPVLLVRQSQGLVRAVQVQEILDTSNLVLKPLGGYVPQIQGVAGAAILGNGSVVPVIDLPDLLRQGGPKVKRVDASRPTNSQPADAGRSGQRRVLVVDDSLSARRGTAQVMKDAGFDVRTAIDGLEALSVLEKFEPDLILADMEMPRMNGLELTFHVRGQERTRHIPVIMITSRSTDKHRHQAKEAGVNVYLTKPFNDDVLLSHTESLLGAVAA